MDRTSQKQPPNTSATRKRRTYWLVDKVTAAHKQRALLLNAKDFDVHFFTTFDAFKVELAARRAGVIILSDDGPEPLVYRTLLSLIAMPELQGGRLILTVAKGAAKILNTAAAGNFRDIIPMDIDPAQWVQRVAFASASRALNFTQPSGQVTLNQISAMAFPARLSWLGASRLCIESRVQPPNGATVNLTGGLANALGVPSIPVVIEETRRTHLLYRFSDAFIAKWSVPETARAAAELTLSDLKQQDSGPRCRVFVAAQAQALRGRLIKALDHPKFEVSAALQKQGVSAEPKYFSPDIVLIEDALCREGDGVNLAELMANLEPGVPMIIFGHRIDIDAMKARFPSRRLYVLPEPPVDLRGAILNRFARVPEGKKHPEDSDACHINSDHEVSFAEVHFPARLTRIHPFAGQVAMPFSVGNFALARLDSPLVRRMTLKNPYVKITATYRDPREVVAPFFYLADFALADTNQADRQAIAGSMAQMIVEHMSRFDSSIPRQILSRLTQTPATGDRTPTAESMPGPVSVAAVAARMEPPVQQSRPLDAVAMGTGNAVEKLDPREEVAPRPAAQELLGQLRPMMKEAEADAEVDEAKELIRKISKASKSQSVRQSLFFVAGLLFLIGIIWALYSAGESTPNQSGKVWSDSFKKFQENQPGNASGR